ncbi:MAG: hypothetical protein KDD62_13955 [Bdellovibrionales bacterium]|nr:hypothetical protein [Bdellovibrionales bacterium]
MMVSIPDPTPGPTEDKITPNNSKDMIVQQLEVCWTGAIIELGLKREPAQEAFQDLVSRYSDSSRHYHNLQHLQNMLSFLEEVRSSVVRMPLVTLAAFDHDAVYDSKAKDNEEQSALLAEETLRELGLPEDEVQFVSSLIMSTKKHHPLLKSSDNKIFLDADLAILGSDPEDYIKYTDAIRQEYAWVDAKTYLNRRLSVMSSFAERDPIYFTEIARTRFQDQAKCNLEAEIRSLEAQIAQNYE